MKKIKGACAVIAGGGYLPRVIYNYCITNKIECHVVLLRGEAEKKLFKGVKTSEFLPYKVSEIMSFLLSHKIQNLFLAGKVKRNNLTKIAFDKQGRELFFTIIRNGLNDKSVFQVITKFFEKNNFNILSYDFIAKEREKTGLINNVYFQKEHMLNIEQGTAIMRGVSSYDIGQALVIESGLILGVECVEGTDELINRCARLHQLKKQAILIKVCKVKQDQRVDLPCVGPKTIKNIAKNGYAGVVFEAKKTVILQFDECCRIADKNKIFIYGI